jgi:hypothetical protein
MMNDAKTILFLVWCPDIGETDRDGRAVVAFGAIAAAEVIAGRIDRGDECDEDHGYTLAVRRDGAKRVVMVEVVKRVARSWSSAVIG